MKVLLLLLLLLSAHIARAVYEENIPRRLIQPDGSQLHCLLSGDEFFNYLHDARGYTIIQGDDGYYYYAQVRQGVLVATAHRADSTDPHLLGLKKRATISREEYQHRKREFQALAGKASKPPLTGSMANLVVYIRFSDDAEFQVPRLQFDQNFNLEEGPSLNHYFREVSYDQLDISSYHFPLSGLTTNVSFQDTNPRAYYHPFHAVTNPIGYDPDVPLNNSVDPSGRTYREHTLLAAAIAFIEEQVPAQLILDANNDGQVDNISFIIRGESGQWNNLMWAHRWVLWSKTVTLNDKIVFDYSFLPETQSGVYAICHEMYHIIGAPDLYRYSHEGFHPVGPWDLMASGFVHMGAWMKYRYTNAQWIQDLPVISGPGTYTLEPLYSSQNNGFRVNSPNSGEEFFVLEYRRRQGHYETNIPGEGLIIYRINPSATGNAQGPPDEVYLFRPQGTLTSNGNDYQAFFSLHSGRTEFHDETQPGGFLQDGSPGGLFITNVGPAAETISFELYPAVAGASPPDDLSAQVTHDHHVVLQWNPPAPGVADPQGPLLKDYRIFRNQELLAVIDDPQVSSFLDEAPLAGSYQYYLRATYTNPETVSYATNIVVAEVPGVFGFSQGTTYDAGWEEGSINLQMTTNVESWQASSSEPWCRVDTLAGNPYHNLVVSLASNPEVLSRTAQITFSATTIKADTVIEIRQLGHPTLAEPPGDPLFWVYPNPVIGHPLKLVFNDPVEEGVLELFSPQGVRLLHTRISAAAGQTLQVATQGYAPGSYLLVIRLKDEMIRKKIMILN